MQPAEAMSGTPKRLRGHSNYDKLIIEWCQTLRSLWLIQLSCCFASIATFKVRN